ncbi:MAG: metallophosphoesterase family protein [Ignavibacteriales bacterium]|nr:metallophosphoesterase family protein [Ignavibacteriales bacterium]
MKYAIISDIHSNLEALQKAFAIIDEKSVDEIICLGDIVGYGANPNECVDIVRSRCSSVVLGNHDAAALDPSLAHDFNSIAKRAITWTADHLTEGSRSFLSSLPLIERREQILFVHSSPNMPGAWDYILDIDDAFSALRHFQERICFIGHTHIPGIFSRLGRGKSIIKDEQYLINVGSVGQPRDGNPMLAFGIFDSSAWEYELIRSEYDIQLAAEKIYAAKLPEELGNRLMYGM